MVRLFALTVVERELGWFQAHPLLRLPRALARAVTEEVTRRCRALKEGEALAVVEAMGIDENLINIPIGKRTLPRGC